MTFADQYMNDRFEDVTAAIERGDALIELLPSRAAALVALARRAQKLGKDNERLSEALEELLDAHVPPSRQEDFLERHGLAENGE